MAQAKKKKVKKISWHEFFIPLDDRVLIQQGDSYQMTAGGIFIPSSAQERPNQGQVLAVGKGHRSSKGHFRPMDVKVGDKVMYAKFSGEKLKLQNQDLLLMREQDIIGVVE